MTSSPTRRSTRLARHAGPARERDPPVYPPPPPPGGGLSRPLPPRAGHACAIACPRPASPTRPLAVQAGEGGDYGDGDLGVGGMALFFSTSYYGPLCYSLQARRSSPPPPLPWPRP